MMTKNHTAMSKSDEELAYPAAGYDLRPN